MPAQATSRVLVLDLDGTLVLDNSFHLFLWEMWKHGDHRMRRRLLYAALIRASSRHSRRRVAMKRRVLDAFNGGRFDLRERVVTGTVQRMRSTLSQPVADILEEWQQLKRPVLLATAAPDCYARPFASSLEIHNVLATPMHTADGWRELSKDAKADSCAAWIQEHVAADARGVDITAVSDHADDLPLLARATHAIVQASPEAFQVIRLALPSKVRVDHIDVTSGESNGAHWLWFDGRPSGPHDRWELETIVSKHRYALIYQAPGTWRRILPGDSLEGAVKRTSSPPPPPLRARLEMAAKRRVVRDTLGIFH
jgi:phosphoserine phosphatase